MPFERRFITFVDLKPKSRKILIFCFSTTTADIEKTGNAPVLAILDQLGGWPVLKGQEWRGEHFDWLTTLIEFRKLGFSHDILMDLSVTPDFRNNTQHIIDVISGLLFQSDLISYEFATPVRSGVTRNARQKLFAQRPQ